jgi:hypothetical protein
MAAPDVSRTVPLRWHSSAAANDEQQANIEHVIKRARISMIPTAFDAQQLSKAAHLV